jgi:hypothetical protein
VDALFSAAQRTKTRHIESQRWNVGLWIKMKVGWYHSGIIFLLLVAVAFMLFFAELWDTLPCNLPNPSLATGATALRFVGRVTTQGIIWINREGLRTGQPMTDSLKGVLFLSGLFEVAGLYLKEHGNTWHTTLVEGGQYCYTIEGIGGPSDHKAWWAILGPAVTHLLMVIGAVAAFKSDRRTLGPHGILSDLARVKHAPLSFREKEILVESVLLCKFLEPCCGEELTLINIVAPRFPVAEDAIFRQ